MMDRLAPTTLARLTAAMLAISAVLFALAVFMEQGGESGDMSRAGARTGAGEVRQEGVPADGAGAEAGESGERAEAAHVETGEGGEHAEETILGVDLEAPWLVWGFVAVSLVLAVAVLRPGRPALLLTILLAGAAALLDAREALSQLGRPDLPIAGLASLVALAHAAAAILAAMAWRRQSVADSAVPLAK
jgi:hypothetical protein